MPRQDRTAARHVLLRRLLRRGEMTTQADLLGALAERGHKVTQTTVSRDLATIGARKDAQDGHYRLPDQSGVPGALEELAARMRRLVREVGSSANLVVLKTAPGGAHTIGAALDAAAFPDSRFPAVLGTVAGDDTLLVITRTPRGGSALAHELERLLES